ncbi:MAG: ammonium transporter [Deltaproteobacteria bacterium]
MVGADTAWIIVASALVLFMTLPGLALFYGGLVRVQNVLSVFLQCYAIACVVSVLWAVCGYSIAFGAGNGLWGGLGKAFASGITPDSVKGTLPEILFFMFQMTFAIITPALIVGAYVERISTGFVLLFSALWVLLVYAPVAHWVWGGGFLSDGGIFGAQGVRDFAGGVVVHETAGLAALVLALMIGKRRDHAKPPHSPGFVMIGAAILWVGWFGFNGGSALAANGEAAMAIVATHLSAAAASLSWAFWERVKFGKFSLVGIVTGTIAGLATITPAAGYVGPKAALVIGFAAGIICQEAVAIFRGKLKIDDALDVFAVHGVGGIFGTICVAIVGAASWTAQIGTLAIVGIFTLVLTYVIAKGVSLVTPMRVSDEDEAQGLDLALHGEQAYDYRG